MATPERIPRIYLDIDGCLSPLPPRPTQALRWDPPGTWPAWVDPEAFNQTPMPVALLDAFANLEGVEVVWATSWPLDMIEWALDKVGYSHLRFRHLNPDAASFSKLDAVRADISRDPVPFVWIDDARLPGEDFWIPPVPWRRIRPQPQFGITVLGWEAAVEWLHRAGASKPPPEAGPQFSELWRHTIADAFAADPYLVARRVTTNIAIYTETAGPPAAELVAALERWERLLDDEDALAKVLDAPTPDWAWETAPPFADVLSQDEHRRLVDLAYGVPSSQPAARRQ